MAPHRAQGAGHLDLGPSGTRAFQSRRGRAAVRARRTEGVDRAQSDRLVPAPVCMCSDVMCVVNGPEPSFVPGAENDRSQSSRRDRKPEGHRSESLPAHCSCSCYQSVWSWHRLQGNAELLGRTPIQVASGSGKSRSSSRSSRSWRASQIRKPLSTTCRFRFVPS